MLLLAQGTPYICVNALYASISWYLLFVFSIFKFNDKFAMSIMHDGQESYDFFNYHSMNYVLENSCLFLLLGRLYLDLCFI